jgi:hypothetical protein
MSLPDPYPTESASGRGNSALADERPLVTLQLAGHSAIPLRCCAVPKPSPTQVTEWGETLTVYCANCSTVLVQVVGPPVSVTG